MGIKIELLRKYIKEWVEKLKKDPVRAEHDKEERLERVKYYRALTAEKLRAMTEDEFYEYIAKLWAMLIWGNKRYVVDKLIQENHFENLKEELVKLVWADGPIENRWDHFRSTIKGMGPAMISEILCHAHPEEFMLWNRRAYVGLRYLGMEDLPRYNYQLTGERYRQLCDTAQQIAVELRKLGIKDANLLTVDYFIWDQLQVEENLSQIYKPEGLTKIEKIEIGKAPPATAEFLHNEIRDKVAEIGQWLGFSTKTEIKVADGSKVDAVWEATIGNMGRVIYVFEVQTKGSLDSLILNLLKSLNNPAVQGVVAVSDADQIERVKKHVAGVSQLKDKLKYWDYTEVLQVHEALEGVNESINRLGLVPQGFLGL